MNYLRTASHCKRGGRQLNRLQYRVRAGGLAAPAQRATQAKLMEIDRNIAQLKRERQRNGIDDEKFREKVDAQMAKKLRIVEEFREKMGG